MAEKMNRKLVLEDGSEYCGYGFGGENDKVCEIVFNTAMIGYQEVVSDPSCTDKIVIMTYTLIGNCGIADEDSETRNPLIGGLVVREYNDFPSNFRYTHTLAELMEENSIAGIYGIDTRKLTRQIRDNGSCKAMITSIDMPTEEAVKKIRETELAKDAVARVSCKKKWYSRTANPKYNVVAVDCGMKSSLVRSLQERGCNVTIVPYNTTAQEIEAMNPDGIFVSNGPGNPEDVTPVIDLVKQMRGKVPMFGMCLGHQIIALACGAKVSKMKFGHHGGNQPIKNVNTGRIEFALQNHDYVVDKDSLNGTGLEVTHVNVLDGTVEGINNEKDRILGVQFYTDDVPGAKECTNMFDMFLEMMREAK